MDLPKKKATILKQKLDDATEKDILIGKKNGRAEGRREETICCVTVTGLSLT